MQTVWKRRRFVFVVSLCGILFMGRPEAPALEAAEASPLFAEIFLAQEKKPVLDDIRKVLKEYSVERVSAQFFRAGYPPKNVVIGSQVPAKTARRVIDLAIEYNRGITHILPQFRFFPHQIIIGSSAFDERVPVPIRPSDLERLRDPNLSDLAFHTLYRDLTGEKKNTLERP